MFAFRIDFSTSQYNDYKKNVVVGFWRVFMVHEK